MAKEINKLSVARVNRLSERGFYGDGNGLYLQVSPTGSKSWVFRFKEHGRTRDMGLGSINDYTLAEARERAKQQRQLRNEGIDPIQARRAAREAQRLEASKTMTFDECATEYFNLNSDHWKNPKHRQQWKNTLKTYCSPIFGKTPIQLIDTPLVLKAIQPIWKEKPETAGRVRGRIETVIDYAKSCGYRSAGENPARWTGHLDNILPARNKVKAVEHHPALPWSKAAEFMTDLRTRKGLAPMALEFTILAASRTNETLGGKWNEIDFAERVWTIPGERMKAGKEHRVALSAPALAILEKLYKVRTSDLIFADDNGKPLSNMAMTMLLRRMKYTDKAGETITVHGFRSTFRDWGFEHSTFPADIIEAALAHVAGDKVEAAYKRGDALAKRRTLMDAWGTHCEIVGGDVVPIKRRKA